MIEILGVRASEYKMKHIFTKTYAELSEKAAKMILEIVKGNPYAVLGLATGMTPLGLYAHMIADHEKYGTSYAHFARSTSMSTRACLKRMKRVAMFEGEPIEIEFEADNGMADKVMDKFGENYELMYCAKEFFRFRAKVCVSPPFFAWITTHLGKIRIKSPQSVKKQLHDFLSHTYE